MPWPPSEKNRSQIQTLIAATLADVTTSLGRVYATQTSPINTVAEKIAALVGSKGQAASWTTPQALANFLVDQLNAMLRPAGEPESGVGEKPLRSIPGFEDLRRQAETITTELTSLPWRYEVLVPTPLRPPDPEIFRCLQLGDGFKIRVFGPDDASRYPLPAEDPFIPVFYHSEYPSEIAVGAIHFVREFTGYISASGFSTDVDVIVHSLKGALGLLVVDNILHVDNFQIGPPRRAIPILSFRITLENNRLLMPLRWLTAEDTQLVGSLNFAGAADSERLRRMTAAFRDDRTLSAARWFFHSFSRTGGAVEGIVSATIAIEALLGDKKQAEKLGLTALLANRLAFLIGYSPKDREKIIRSFARLYDLRSTIVHSGKATLDHSDQQALSDLQQLGSRALSRQIADLNWDS